ncbi:MAG: hypothetical protein LBB45_07620 [Methanobrevibacter sp.]|jgi:hypothetical protein|nr:hypothetical protein [Candidatus Methanovirga basalitermitum]
MEGELINNFTEYENDSKSALILFLLFYLTFVVDANFRFTSENQYLIDDFIKMNLISRKDKIKELFGKFKNGAIEQIKYSTDSKNKSRDKCLYPLLFFTAILDGNFNYL